MGECVCVSISLCVFKISSASVLTPQSEFAEARHSIGTLS